MKKLFHFAMIGGILNSISVCVDRMRSVLESVVSEMFKIFTFILLSFESR